MGRRLASICQRVPFATHVLVLGAACFGPRYAPTAYSLLFFAIHCILCVTNIQSICGVWAAVQGVKAQTLGRWREPPSPRELEAEGDAGIRAAQVEHVVIIPNYKESWETLQETLECLASHPSAHSQYYVCLAMESREDGAEAKANELLRLFDGKFKSSVYTLHPAGIEGEAAGKASNVNWAARYIAASTAPALRARQIVTCLDSDILIAADYFERAALIFVRSSAEERARTMFAMPIVFDRNAGDVPRGVAATDVMWSIAGLACTYPSAIFKTPTSAYSVSMELAIFVGFWCPGPEAIGEDFHMACKAFISTGGELICHTIYSPASVTDVVGSRHGEGWVGWWSDLNARYKQAVRHLWGSLDTGYCLARLLGPVAPSRPVSLASPPFGALRPPSPSTSLSGLSSEESDLSGDTAVDLPHPSFKVASAQDPQVRPPMPIFKGLALLARLCQAHLMLVHFFIVLTAPRFLRYMGLEPLCAPADAAPTIFSSPWTLAWAFEQIMRLFPSQAGDFASCASGLAVTLVWVCELIRVFSFISTVTCFVLYHFYRKRTLARWSRPDALVRFGRRPGTVYDPSFWRVIDCVALPFGIFFAIVPALWAHACHLFTNKLVYTTSFKPTKLGAPASVGLPKSC